MARYPKSITERFHGTPEQLAAGLVGDPPRRWSAVVVDDYDPSWPLRFETTRAALTGALGDLVLAVEHVGSTAVPGLPAKPVVDVDLTVPDSDDESSFVPVLAPLGYRLVLREPWWHGHRMLVSAADDVHLHVWPPGAPEPIRHLLFRDWLREHPSDRDLYAGTKRRLAGETVDRPGDYSLAKNDVIDAIFARIFAA
ncbi:GrpB family protein [Dactylosporangium sp. CA-152071]|uniref:GrpB family protein n=1 Tax=Dactylosporangium sp. CA-152071 TaxID=3239933 RepID=UPI003D8B84DE